MTTEYGEIFETVLGSGTFDEKGREVGYIVGFRDNGTDFRAYVQNARRNGHEWKEFGVTQRSKGFASQESARQWAYGAARSRIQKLKGAA